MHRLGLPRSIWFPLHLNLHSLHTQVQQQIEIESNVHEATAEFLDHLSKRLQEQSINWGGRRDDDLSGKEQDLEHLRANHARDAHRLRDMEEKHEKELHAKEEREQKQADATELAESEATRLSKMRGAAIIIQAAWRGYALRKSLKGGKGKGGKGGKGKKKK